MTNRELVSRHVDAGNRYAFDELAALSTADIEMDMSRSIGPAQGTYRGLEEVTAFLESYVEAFESVIATPTDFYERGDWVAVEVQTRFRGRGSGAETAARGARVYGLRDGKVARYSLFQDMDSAREFVDAQP
jgi:ketosteroid isomerase-like protein